MPSIPPRPPLSAPYISSNASLYSENVLASARVLLNGTRLPLVSKERRGGAPVLILEALAGFFLVFDSNKLSLARQSRLSFLAAAQGLSCGSLSTTRPRELR